MGEKFARVEFVCCLSMIAQQWSWRLRDGDDAKALLSCKLIFLRLTICLWSADEPNKLVASVGITLKTRLPVKLIFERRQ